MSGHDVVVVGAGIAGSAAAVLLGRAGLRVALVERHRDPETFKVLCTHHVMACATATIRRLGLDRRIEAAGGIRNGLDAYTPWGWVRTPPGMPHGYSIRRQKLDPMLRAMAGETPGVDLLLGSRVVGLHDGSATVTGVRLRAVDGTERTLRCRLVVGADGAHSAVARLAGAQPRVSPNERFIFFAQYSGVRLSSGSRSQLWMHEPGLAYALPNDDGVTVLAAVPTKAALPDFRSDREAALISAVRHLPEGPLLDGADRVSPVVGATDCPLVTRPAVPAPGVALVGDAAMTSDPSQGVGCGWAFQGAEWLADAVIPALRDGAPLAPALRRYERRRRPLRGHESTVEQEALAGPPTALDRLMLQAAVRDPRTAAHLLAFFNRTISVRQFVAPRAMSRAVWVAMRNRRSHDMPR